MIFKFNNKHASSTVQSGVNSVNQQTIWNKGITGAGQIVGCGDSGIDMSHSFFYDSHFNTPISTTNNNHRKVIRYDVSTGADAGDVFEGHGTHIAGTIAGEASCINPSAQIEMTKYNGIAYKAKLAFVDIASKDSKLKLPSDLYNNYFKLFQNAGARISSHSWTCAAPSNQSPITACNKYSTSASEVDRFAYDNPDHLIVFSAGNTGLSGSFTVQAPATSKNVLSIGSSITTQYSWDELCQNTHNADALSECAYLRKRSGEGVSEYSARGYSLPDTRVKPDLIAPGHFIVSARSNGEESESTNQCTPFVCKTTESYACPNTTGLIFMRGTSQSAPIVSASAALIRQYLMDGFYPTGTKVTGNKLLSVSSALLRAMIIHSAVPVTGSVNLDEQGRTVSLETQPVPNIYEGFGRIQLDQVLAFGTDTTLQSQLFLQTQSTITNKKTQKYCFLVQDKPTTYESPIYNHELKATLAWTDPAGSVVSGYALVNDLDLLVSDEYNKIYYSNSADKFDHTNTVEMAYLPGKGSLNTVRYYAVHVHGFYVQSNQDYALVVTSGQKLTSVSCASTPLSPCIDCGSGTCDTATGTCSCPSNKAGVDCSSSLNALEGCEPLKTSVAPASPGYFQFTRSGNNYDMIVYVGRKTSSTYPKVYISSTTQTPSSSNNEFKFATNSEVIRLNTTMLTAKTYYIAVTTTSSMEVTVMAFEEPAATLPLTLGQPFSGCTVPAEISLNSFVSLDLFNVRNLMQPLSIPQYYSAAIRLSITGAGNRPYAYATYSHDLTRPTLSNYDQSLVATVESDTYLYRVMANPNITRYSYLVFGIWSTDAGPFTLQVDLLVFCAGTTTITANPSPNLPLLIRSHEGNGLYSSNNVCVWNLQPSDPKVKHIKLKFNRFALDDSDKLVITGGPSSRGLKAVSNHTLTGPFRQDTIIIDSRKATLQFIADLFFESSGFEIEYSVLYAACENSCSANGNCVNDICECKQGYYGPDCSKLGCPSVTCQGNGRCRLDMIPPVCECAPGYWGDDCEFECPGGHKAACSYRGKCNQRTGSCACDTGYYGSACQYKSCGNCGAHGTCNPATGQCICSKGYYGASCESECPGGAKNPCNNRGTCVNGVCNCFNAFYGSSCEFKDCTVTCVQGTCDFSRGECSCSRGYYGPTCTSICLGGVTTPCNNNGNCSGSNGICECSGEWSGVQCSSALNVVFMKDGAFDVTVPANDQVAYKIFIKELPSQSGRTSTQSPVYSKANVPEYLYDYVLRATSQNSANPLINVFIAYKYVPNQNLQDERPYVLNSQQAEFDLNNIPQGYQYVYVVFENNRNYVSRVTAELTADRSRFNIGALPPIEPSSRNNKLKAEAIIAIILGAVGLLAICLLLAILLLLLLLCCCATKEKGSKQRTESIWLGISEDKSADMNTMLNIADEDYQSDLASQIELEERMIRESQQYAKRGDMEPNDDDTEEDLDEPDPFSKKRSGAFLEKSESISTTLQKVESKTRLVNPLAPVTTTIKTTITSTLVPQDDGTVVEQVNVTPDLSNIEASPSKTTGTPPTPRRVDMPQIDTSVSATGGSSPSTPTSIKGVAKSTIRNASSQALSPRRVFMNSPRNNSSQMLPVPFVFDSDSSDDSSDYDDTN